MNVAISDGMRERLLSLGVPPDRVQVIHNWADDEHIRPVAPQDNTLRRSWRLENAFVVGYSGNLGRAHEVDTILGAAERLRERPEITFLFIGGGHHWTELKSAVRERELTSFVFKPFEAQENRSQSLSVADVHWVSLRPALDGLILPSKIYGIAAAGRPCIAITQLNSELARFVDANRIGRSVAIGDSETLAAILADMADDADMRLAMGQQARRTSTASYSRVAALQNWAKLISAISPGPAASAT
jgi:glycosyltransferase involved in cell wall biosynthesis